MVPSWRATSAAGMTLLLGLFSSGCSNPGGFITEPPATTDLAGNSSFGPLAPAQSGEKSDSMPANESLPAPAGVWVCDEVTHGCSTFMQVNGWSPLLATGASTAPDNTPQTVWGIIAMRGFPVGQVVASNGVEYNPLFLLDLDFNIMLWRQQRLYLFADSSFWGQKAAPGITNAAQGSFDFSKREFDFNVGAAWNYAEQWEARFFGYSFNNLNRGNSQTSPSGFNDGIGLENRYYIGEAYSHLGTTGFDEALATFLSVGYYPSKSMVDGNGNEFRPGVFARAYLAWGLWGEQCYLYGDVQFIMARSFQPTLLNWDAGLAARPFSSVPRLEFRVGTLDMLDLQARDLETGVYMAIRYVY